MTAPHANRLVDRVRDRLASGPPVREVKMVGGLSFMVDNRMVVSVRSDSELLVRADPDRAEELLGLQGARPAEMGAGRAMSTGWISVDEAALSTDENVVFWVGVALEYDGREARSSSRRQKRTG